MQPKTLHTIYAQHKSFYTINLTLLLFVGLLQYTMDMGICQRYVLVGRTIFTEIDLENLRMNYQYTAFRYGRAWASTNSGLLRASPESNTAVVLEMRLGKLFSTDSRAYLFKREKRQPVHPGFYLTIQIIPLFFLISAIKAHPLLNPHEHPSVVRQQINAVLLIS